MRKKIFSVIQEEIDKEIQDLDLQAILKQAQIDEEIKTKPKIKVNPWINPLLKLAFILILLFAIIIKPSFNDPDSTQEQLQSTPNHSLLFPSLTLYQLLEKNEVVPENEVTHSFLWEDVRFINRYIKTIEINYFDSPAFKGVNPKKGYQKTFQIKNLTISLKTTNQNKCEIEIDDKNTLYKIEGYIETNRIILKLFTGENSFIEIQNENDNLEIKTYQEGNLASHAKLTKVKKEVKIDDVLSKTTYLVKNNNPDSYIISYIQFGPEHIEENGSNPEQEPFISAIKINGTFKYEVSYGNETYIFNIQE